MIPKIPNKRRDGGTDFSALVSYVADKRKTTGGEVWTYNVLDVDTAAIEMRACASQNTRVHDPVVHVVVSWQEGEHPTAEQARVAGEQALRSLGFDLGEEGHQAVIALHQDTDNIHIHIVASRVHPESGKAVDMWQSHKTLHDACRRIELEQGWNHDRGLAEVVTDEQGQSHIVMREYDPEQRGTSLSTGAADMEAHTRGCSFERFIKETVGPAMRDAVKSGDWQRVHEVLAECHVDLVPRGGGYVFLDRSRPEQYHAKGGIAGSWARGARLTKKLGEYAAPGPNAHRTNAVRRYDPEAADGIEELRRPRPTPRPQAGAKRKPRDPAKTAARKVERDDLYRQYKEEQARRWDEFQAARRAAMADFRAYAAELRGSMKKELAERKKQAWETRRQSPAGERITPAVMRSLLALERATLREQLAARIKRERAALVAEWQAKRGNLKRRSWREWLRERASEGDEAAKRALKGLRYRGQVEDDARLLSGLRPGEPDDVGAVVVDANLVMVDLEGRAVGDAVVYSDAAGGDVAVDYGDRISVLDEAERAAEQSLRLAAAKWGGTVRVSGADREWVERTARLAAQLGIRVTGDGRDAWEAEREALEEARRRDRPGRGQASAGSRARPTDGPPGAGSGGRRGRVGVDVDALKAGVDLVELAGRFGWEVDRKGSTATSFKMRRGDDAPIVIQRREGGDGFFSADDRAKGDAISFYRWETGEGFQAATAALSDMAGIAQRPAAGGRATKRGQPRSEPNAAAVLRRYAAGEPLTREHVYGQARGIPAEVLISARDARTDRQYGNLLFAHRDAAGTVIGYEYKGAGAAGFSSGGRRGLYVTGEVEAPVRIVITESGLDALSVQALEVRDDTLYASIGGALAPHQVEQIGELVRRHQGAEVIAAFDRDSAGDRYTEKLREALPEARDGRESLEVGQDWNDVLRDRARREQGPADAEDGPRAR